MTARWLPCAVILTVFPISAHADHAKRSLPTESAEAEWTRPGFRVQLGVAGGHLAGLDGAPSGHLIGPVMRAGLRLDADWSLLASFQYTFATQNGGLSGLRYAAAVEPTWHVTPRVSVALGLGVGGIVEGRTGRPDPVPLPSTLDTSYTFPDASTPVASCKGIGVAGLARVDWMYVVGRKSSTGVAVEVTGQWTACNDDTGRVEPDTARPIVRRQFWPHVGATLSWMWSWR